jgi:apolipoprotein D and lipocalin family protein
MLSTIIISAKSPDQTIKSTFEFKLDKYLGTWYEIARFDHSFERGLEGATANYSLMDNGKIKVVNSGYKNGFNGKLNTAIGKAKLASPNTPRNLKVSFFLFFIHHIIFWN